MSYKVIVDSCGELTAEMKASGRFETASLGLEVGDCHIIDDESFNQAEFLKNVAECPTCPKSSCPSPETFMEGYHCDAEHVYAVTLSSELSGSYNSAVLGKNLYEEEYGEKDIYVFNSKSASVGQTLIGMKIAQCEERGMTFKEVVAAVEAYIEEQHTYFVLETLETLRKNGRLTGLKAHCNCPQRAQDVKKMLEERVKLKDIIILDTRGVSSMYANDGGVIIAV